MPKTDLKYNNSRPMDLDGYQDNSGPEIERIEDPIINVVTEPPTQKQIKVVRRPQNQQVNQQRQHIQQPNIQVQTNPELQEAFNMFAQSEQQTQTELNEFNLRGSVGSNLDEMEDIQYTLISWLENKTDQLMSDLVFNGGDPAEVLEQISFMKRRVNEILDSYGDNNG